MPRVLIAEDEAAIADAVLYALRSEGIDADHCLLARDVVPRVRAGGIDVVVLDVGLPDIDGFTVLAELRRRGEKVPVLMLTAKAREVDIVRALELGAVHCFPKPLHTSREEFDATVRQLGDIVLKAAAGELKPGGEGAEGGESGGAKYRSDGRIVALACGAAGIESARQVLAAYDAACPPTIVLFDADPAAVEHAVRAMRHSLPCQLGDAVDGVSLEPGKVWLAHDPTRHVIVEAGEPPRLRLVERDPVNGCRPSADLLFGSQARSGVPKDEAGRAVQARGLQQLVRNGHEELAE